MYKAKGPKSNNPYKQYISGDITAVKIEARLKAPSIDVKTILCVVQLAAVVTAVKKEVAVSPVFALSAQRA